MMRAILYEPATAELIVGGDEMIERWRRDDAGILWLDFEDPELAGVEPLLESFGIHTLAIQDATRTRHPPKVERFESFLFVLLRGLDATTSGIDFGVIQLGLFVGDRFLVTVHRKPSVSANGLFESVKRDPGLIENGPGKLLVSLTNSLARRYVEILLGLEPRLDEIEEEIFEKPNDELLEELTGYKARLRNLRRIATYHGIVAEGFRTEGREYIDPSLVHEVTDLDEQIERTRSLADLYYEVARDLTDGYLALSSHRLNRVMQILTVITVIFVPLTFLAGIYGMNFENMPELSTQGAYFVVLGVMLAAAVTQLVYFRRKGWV